MIRKNICLLLILAGLLQAQTVEIPLNLEETAGGRDSFIPYCRIKTPAIALALSGGGSRGLAQIGVLKVLERHGIPVHAIAGTSIGAIVGGLYSAGYTAKDLDSLARQISWDEIIHDTPPRQQLFMSQKSERSRHILQMRFQGLSINIQSAYTGGLRFNELLTELIWKAPYPVSRKFDDLLIPFHAVSTDLLTGKKIVLSEGSMIEALRSSMTIPLLFTPVKKDGAWLVDGGLVQNLPVEEARNMGCDLVIAVDTSSKMRQPEHLGAPWEIADQVTTIMSQQSTIRQYELADVGIQPELNDFSNTDFSRIDELIDAGEKAAEKAIPKIDSMLASWDPVTDQTCYPVRRILVCGCLHTDEQECLERLSLDIDQPVSLTQIQWAGQRLYESGQYTRMQAFLDTSLQDLTFYVTETPFIQKIEILGNTVFPDSLILSLMETAVHENLDIQKGRRDIRRLLTLYHRAGFTLVRLQSRHVADQVLHLHIDEGRIRNIRIQGCSITRPFVVKRELTISPDQLFNITLVNQSVRNIYSTGYFKEVGFEVSPLEDNYDLVFHVSEYQYTLARIGLRYDLERKTKGFVEIMRDNIFGIGAEGFLTGLIGSRDVSTTLGLRADRLYNSFLTSSLEIGCRKSQYTYYDEMERAGEYSISQFFTVLGAGRQMQRLGTVILEIRSEIFHVDSDTWIPVNLDRTFLQTICIRSEVDTRDRMPFPNKGKYHHLQYETSARFLGSEVNFARLSSWMESYYPLRRNMVFHPRIFWGTADLSTPFPKNYSLGGLHSFFGLADRALIGKRCFLFSHEIRARLRWIRGLESYLSLRYDFGGVWGRYSKIEEKDFKHGIGVVLSLNSFAGPLQFAAGRTSEGRHRLYLSLGHDF
ncbi:patatin-like phospholipase family protein [bacterium]|nr:patatin-like phospholipase family protein [bacterium]